MEILNDFKTSLADSLANKLFLTYLDMEDALIYNYVSVRNGDWNALYIDSLSGSLAYLAASGHRSYTKTVLVYQ